MPKTQEYSASKTKLKNSDESRFSDQLLPFEIGYLPAYFQRKAEIELNESPERMQKSIRQMRELAKTDKNFDGQTFDDDFILQFLRGRKYDVASAFARFRNFVILRRRNFETFTDIKFESISPATRKNIITILPRRCPEGCAILHVQLDNWNPEEFPVEDLKRAVVVLIAQSMRYPMTQVNGYKVILNMKSNPIKHLRFCTPSNIYLIYHGTQECMAGKFKEIHIVNKSKTFTVGFAIIKPFISYKLKQRLVFHSNPETLSDYFPRSVLPKDYGGDLENIDMTNWLSKVSQPDKLETVCGVPPPMH